MFDQINSHKDHLHKMPGKFEKNGKFEGEYYEQSLITLALLQVFHSLNINKRHDTFSGGLVPHYIIMKTVVSIKDHTDIFGQKIASRMIYTMWVMSLF